MMSADDDSSKDIFSEDVKDSSMYMIESSDEDDRHDNETQDSQDISEILLRDFINHEKYLIHAKNEAESDLKENACPKARRYSELHDQFQGTSAMITEMSKYFEKSVDSLFEEDQNNAFKPRRYSSNHAVKDEPKEISNDGADCNVGSTDIRDGKQKRNPSATPRTVDSRRGRRNQQKRNRQHDLTSYPEHSDGDYIPSIEEYESGNKKKKNVTRARGKARGNGKQDDIEKELDNLVLETMNELDEIAQPMLKSRGQANQGSGKLSVRNTTIEHDDPLLGCLSQGYTNGIGLEPSGNAMHNAFLSEDSPDNTQGYSSGEANLETVCLKFVIVDENRSIIKDDRLQAVHVNRRDTLGSLAEKFGSLFGLETERFKDIAFYIDGDQQPHHITIDNEELAIEEGMQIDVKFPLKGQERVQGGYISDNLNSHQGFAYTSYSDHYFSDAASYDESSTDCEIIEID